MRTNSFLATATAFIAVALGVSASAVMSGAEKRQTEAIVCPISDELVRCCRILSTVCVYSFLSSLDDSQMFTGQLHRAFAHQLGHNATQR